jgi:hypothetical protein
MPAGSNRGRLLWANGGKRRRHTSRDQREPGDGSTRVARELHEVADSGEHVSVESGDVAGCGVCMSASTTASLLNSAADYDAVIGRRFLQQPCTDTEIYRRNLIESPL